MDNLNWQYFPKSDKIPIHLKEVVKDFEKQHDTYMSSEYTLKVMMYYQLCVLIFKH